VAGAGINAPTQSTLGASQFRKTQKRARKVNVDGDSEDDESGEEMQESEVVGPVELLQKKMGEFEVRYQALSLRNRYATHNSYIEFKQYLHDAQNPGDGAPPLPHSSTWFPADTRESKTPNSTAPPGAFPNEASDAESEIEVMAERIDLKCPITQALMQDPVTSAKCPHSFEREAILQMIQQSQTTTLGEPWRRGMPKTIPCPVCGVILTPEDLQRNPVLVRKIKRLRATESQGYSYDDLDGSMLQRTPGRRETAGFEIGSDDDTTLLRDSQAAEVKSSPRTPRARGRSSAVDDGGDEEMDDDEGDRPPPSSRGLVVDLGGSDEEDDEEEEDG